jgi:tetratricopeptide (TPR) repeat protein
VSMLAARRELKGGNFQVSYAATAMPIRLAMEGHKWDSAVTLQPMPDSPPNVTALVFWARAVANARSGRPQATADDIAQLDLCQRQLEHAGNAYAATQVAVLSKEAGAWKLAASSHPAEAVEMLRKAADDEDNVEKRPLTPGPIVPAREQLGDLLLEQNHPEQALREFRAALVSAPGRRGALVGGIQAAELLGDTEASKQMQAALGN